MCLSVDFCIMAKQWTLLFLSFEPPKHIRFLKRRNVMIILCFENLSLPSQHPKRTHTSLDLQNHGNNILFHLTDNLFIRHTQGKKRISYQVVRSSFSGFNKESWSTPELVMLWGCRYFIANLCHFMGNWMTSQNKNAEKSLSAIVVCMFSPIHTWTTWNYGSEDNSFNFWVVQNFGFVKKKILEVFFGQPYSRLTSSHISQYS